MDSASIASLLHEFQRSLLLFADDQDAPIQLASSSTDPRVCPRPPTPPRPPHPLKRPAPTERSDTTKPDSARSWRSRRRDKDESAHVQNQRTRFLTPDSDEEPERARVPSDTARRTTGPLRSILRNKHADTPYQRLPARHAVRWAAAP